MNNSIFVFAVKLFFDKHLSDFKSHQSLGVSCPQVWQNWIIPIRPIAVHLEKFVPVS